MHHLAASTGSICARDAACQLPLQLPQNATDCGYQCQKLTCAATCVYALVPGLAHSLSLNDSQTYVHFVPFDCEVTGYNLLILLTLIGALLLMPYIVRELGKRTPQPRKIMRPFVMGDLPNSKF